MHIDPESRHGWQALRYAARHLSDAEQREFEDRLAADQTAREAVAQAVELAHTATFLHLESETELSALTASLRSAPSASTLDAALAIAAPAAATASAIDTASAIETAPQRVAVGSWTNAAGWWSAAVAACVAIVALWSANRPENRQSNPASPIPSSEQLSLDVTSAWADLNAQKLVSTDSSEETASEQLTSVRELTRESDDALMLDWLMNGLRQDGLNPEDRVP
jgi:hypothetical protein